MLEKVLQNKRISPPLSGYAREQALFAKMQPDERDRKRRERVHRVKQLLRACLTRRR